MREWRAAVEYDPITGSYAIRLAQKAGDGYHNVAVSAQDGHATMQRVPMGYEVPRFVSLPREAVDALRDALDEKAPRASDADLREALQVERGRVDRVLASLTGAADE